MPPDLRLCSGSETQSFAGPGHATKGMDPENVAPSGRGRCAAAPPFNKVSPAPRGRRIDAADRANRLHAIGWRRLSRGCEPPQPNQLAASSPATQTGQLCEPPISSAVSPAKSGRHVRLSAFVAATRATMPMARARHIKPLICSPLFVPTSTFPETTPSQHLWFPPRTRYGTVR